MVKITKQQKEEIRNLYLNLDFSIEDIAKKYSISKASVNGYTKSIRGNQRRGALVINNPFEDLSSPEVQYWLGFLATDGCISKGRISLFLKEEDKECIENFNKFLGGKTTIRVVPHKKFGKIFNQIGLSFRNKEVAKFLENLGITERKTATLNIKFPITFDFLRGVIDGDGSIQVEGKDTTTRNRIRISGQSKIFLDQIENFLLKNGIMCKNYKTKRNSEFYDFHIHRNKDLLLLIDKLYKNAHTYLQRKYDNAAQIRNNLMKTPEPQETSIGNPEASQQLLLEFP